MNKSKAKASETQRTPATEPPAPAWTVEHVETRTRTVFKMRQGRMVKRVIIEGLLELDDAEGYAEAQARMQKVKAQLATNGPPAEGQPIKIGQ